MSEIVNQSLLKTARGAVLVFVGTGIGMLLGFGSRVMVARYVTQSEYGIYSLAFMLLNIFATISGLGLITGTIRQVAFYRGKGDESKVRGVVLSSVEIVAVSSIFFSIVLFLTSNLISTKLFHVPELTTPLRILCIAIPFFTLIQIFTSIFGGFERAKPNVYFSQILRNASFPLLLLAVILLNLPFVGVIWALVASIVLTFAAFAAYTIKKLPLALRGEKGTSISPVAKELLLFSLAFLGISILYTGTTWIDTLMLGYFMLPSDVGLYNAAQPFTSLLLMVLTAATFLYLPIVSQLYAKNQKDEMKRTYTALTKWIFMATLPIFLILVLFPEATLNILFGSRYIAAAPALQILSLGFFIQTILGTSSYILTAMGHVRFIMWSVLISFIADVALNIILIPIWGIVGAAIATASARALTFILLSARLYSLSKIHPFTKNYLKPAITSVILILGIYALVKSLFSVIPLWLLPVLLILFFGTYFLSVLLTRSFDKEDIMMLLTIEEKLGINLTAIKRILRRFV
jgi:O-antigen/teichoic acid export membrane protein